MKKFKSILVSLCLVFCFAFLFACNDPAPINQLDIKPTINTQGSFSTDLSKDQFNKELTKDVVNESTGETTTESIIKYNDNVSGINYYLTTETTGLKIEANILMKFTYVDNTITPSQCAMKMVMKNTEMSENDANSSISVYAYVKDFAENKIYVNMKTGGFELKQYYPINDSTSGGDGIDFIGTIENAEFNPSEIMDFLGEYTNLVNSIKYSKTEKDANGIVKYKLSFNSDAQDSGSVQTLDVTDSSDDSSETQPEQSLNGNMEICLIIKEIGDEKYFEGISVESNLTDGSVVNKTSMIIKLFSDNITFPSDLNSYVQGQTQQTGTI